MFPDDEENQVPEPDAFPDIVRTPPHVTTAAGASPLIPSAPSDAEKSPATHPVSPEGAANALVYQRSISTPLQSADEAALAAVPMIPRRRPVQPNTTAVQGISFGAPRPTVGFTPENVLGDGSGVVRRFRPAPQTNGTEATNGTSAAADRAARLQARENALLAREQTAEVNSRRLEVLKQRGIKHYLDPETGLVVPERDQEGKLTYTEDVGPVEYDAHGRAIQKRRDETGAVAVKVLDEKAKIGTHPDTPNVLYKQNKNAGWDYLGTVDEGLASKDPAIKGAAEKARLKLDKSLHTAGSEALGLNVYNASEALKTQLGEVRTKSERMVELNRQIQAIPDEKLQERTGGFLGTQIGAQPTQEATALQAQKATLETELEALRAEGYTGTPKVDMAKLKPAKQAVTAARSEHAAWGGVPTSKPGELETILQQRRKTLAESGGDPATDPVIAAVEKQKTAMGLPTTAETEAATASAKAQAESDARVRAASDLANGLATNPDKAVDHLTTAVRAGAIDPQAAPAAMAAAHDAADAKKKADALQKTNPTLADQFRALGLQLLSGLGTGLAELVKSPIGQGVIAANPLSIASALTGHGTPEELAKRAAAGIVAGNPKVEERLKDTVGGKIGNFAGGVVPYVAANLISGPAAPVIDASLFFSSGYQSTYDDAKAHGASEDVAHATALTNGAVNAALALPLKVVGKAVRAVFGETAPKVITAAITNAFAKGGPEAVGELLGKLSNAIKAGGEGSAEMRRDSIAGIQDVMAEIRKPAAQRIADVAKTTAAHAAVGAGVQTVQNLVSQTYDPTRGTFEGVPEQAIGFGVLAGMSKGFEQVALARKAKQALDLIASAKPGEGAAPAQVPGLGGPAPTKPTAGMAHAEIDGLQASEHVTPEQVGPTQEALRGLVKIGTGQPIESLTAAERTALTSKHEVDGLPRVEMVKGPEGSKPVITQAALDRVEQVAPTVRALLPADEESQRTTILSGSSDNLAPSPKEGPAQPATTERSQQDTPSAPIKSASPAKGSQEVPRGTFAVSVENAKGETKTIEVQAADEKAAHAQVAATIPAGTGLIRSVDRLESEAPSTNIQAPEKLQAPTDFVGQAVAQVRGEAGRDLKPPEEKRVRELAGMVAPHYDRWSKAFAVAKVTLRSMRSHGGGGGAGYSPSEKTLTVSLPDLTRHLPLFKGEPEHAANIMSEEAIHSVSTALEDRDPTTHEARGPIDLVKIFKALPEKARAAMKGAYKAGDDDYKQAHEFWRMFMQGQLELARGGKIKLKGKFLQEQSSRNFVVENRRALGTLMRYFRNMEGELRRQKTGEDVISEVGRAITLLRAKVKEVDAHAAPASEEKADGSDAKQVATAVGESGARGPPEPKGSAGAAGGALETRGGARGPGAIATASEVASGKIGPDTGKELSGVHQGRRQITGGTGETETPDRSTHATIIGTGVQGGENGVQSIGRRSRITQNGRTVEVAYVAQDASAARPSHDIQGRATPGYDQSLQPRDRSLAQYRKQSQNIANDLDFAQAAFFPDTETPATTADLGAPVMTQAGDTLIGNGREIGIKAAYDQASPAARKYKRDFVRHAAKFGIDPKAVMAMPAPILKRVIISESGTGRALTKEELVRFSQESNAGAAMATNALETAASDATRITPGLLSLFDPNYALDSQRNSDFVKAYTRDVIRSEGANEANLTKSDLTRRIRAAIFAHAYGMDETGRAAIERMAGDEADAGGKTITGGLLTVAPLVARLRSDIASGEVYPLDISAAVSRAAQDISEALRERGKVSAEVALRGLRDQGELAESANIQQPSSREAPNTKLTAAVRDFLIDNRTKRAEIEQGISNYVEGVYRLGNPKQEDFFQKRELANAELLSSEQLKIWKNATTPAALDRTAERTLAAQALEKAVTNEKGNPRDVYFAAGEAKPELDRVAQEIAQMVGGRAVAVRLKSMARAAAKVAGDYGGDWSQIKDVARATIEVKTLPEAIRAMREIERRFGVAPKRNTFLKPLANGYRDALFHIPLGGTTVEIQVHVPEILHAKSRLHALYKRAQELERNARTENRELNPDEKTLLDRLNAAQRRVYDERLGINSAASSALQVKAPSEASSSGAIGLGESVSSAQAVPSESMTTAKGESPGTSMNDLAPGNRAVTSSSFISPSSTQRAGAGQRLFAQQLGLFDEQTQKLTPPANVRWGDDLQAAFRKQKTALTRAHNAKDFQEIIELADDFESYWEAKGTFPDDWARWQRAKEDAQLALRMGSYAVALPAAAKASKPALRRQVAQDVPGLAGDENALEDLFALAQPKAAPAEAPTSKDQATGKLQTSSSIDAEHAAKAEKSWRLSNWVENTLHKGGIIKSPEMFAKADELFGGTQANGVYTPKDAYDAAEMAINRIIRYGDIYSPQTRNPLGAIESLKDLISRLPTQTKRTAETDEFQQFSTVPPLAFVANWVANIKRGDVVLEPSAGVGGLAAFAQNAGAQTVVNELSPRRLALLERMGHDVVTGENAEQIDNTLDPKIQPNVVVMNPPFSATAGRMQGTRETSNATRHIEQAMARLPEGGRLVAIVGEGMAADRAKFKPWFSKLAEKGFALRANIAVSGLEYAKYGTTWDNQILVIDKNTGLQSEPVVSRVEKVEDLIPLLEEIRNDRPESVGSLTGERGGVATTERSPQSTGERTDQESSVSTGRGIRGVSATEQSGVGEVNFGGERPTGSGETGLGLGERQGAGQERAEIHRGSSERPVSVPDGLERAEVSRGERRTDEALTDAVFDSYVPRIVVPGATMPPVEVQESAAMASVDPITPTYRPALPTTIYQPQHGAKEGKISALAMESVTLAGNAHQSMVPLEYTDAERELYRRENNQEEPPKEVRRGFFIGDGTGMGKGRQVMGVILDNWLQGRKKAIWVTEKPALINDAKRDADDVANMGSHIFDVSKAKLTDPIRNPTGIAFVSYATLRSEEKNAVPGAKAKSRVDQIVNWFGKDFDGVIALDESHNLANNTPMKGKRGLTKPSEQALAGLELQRRLPQARIIYLSATGATEVANLGYAERLGLWGPGTAFANKGDFISKVSSGGVAAMELVARDMKVLGSYVARAISWKGVTYDTIDHALSPEQREVYDTLAEAWQGVLNEMDAALEVVGAVTTSRDGTKKTDPAAKSAARSAFWGAHQRFFNQVITSMKMPSALNAADAHLADGKAIVLQLVNTNEAAQNRAIEARRASAAESGDEADLEDLDMTPRDVLMQMVERSFPVTQREQYTDSEGVLRFRIALDSSGSPIINREAVAMREDLLDRLGAVRVPDGPLEMLLNHFGKDKLAEVTGRTQRVVWGKDKDGNRARVVEKRSKAHGIKEAQEFMDDKRQVLVFSNAGGTGRSYHADLRAKNQRVRVHMLLQPGWEASKAVQGFGRTHRNNQKQPPHYSLASSDVVGEKRFMSSIARRLDQLGALTKGSRQTGSQGLFKSRDNLESEEAKTALKMFYSDAMAGGIPGIEPGLIEQEMGLKMRDKDGQPLADLPPITQFLNRILSLKLGTQEAVFEAFSDRLDRVIEQKIAAGTLDQGMENLTALSTKVDEEKVIHTDARTGAQTRYVKLRLNQPNERLSFSEKATRFFQNKQSGRVYLGGKAQTTTETSTGRLVDQSQLHGITGKQWVNKNVLEDPERWTALSPEAARPLWEEQYAKVPETKDETVHFISGTILPVWDRLNTSDRAMQVKRVQTDDGKRMIGMVISAKELPTVMKNFGTEAESEKIGAEMAVRGILDDGATARLSNGWRLVRRRVAGDNRIELIGPSLTNHAEMDMAGVFRERIAFQTRYFVPVEKAISVIQKLTEARPVVELAMPGDVLAAQALDTYENPQLDFNKAEADAEKSAAARFKEASPLALKIAGNYANVPGVEIKDVQQHALMALARASKAYDASRGIPFAALARVSVNNALRGLYRTQQRHAGLEGASLDVPVASDEGPVTRKDLIADEGTSPRVAAERAEGDRILSTAIGELPERMRGAIEGILAGESLESIGERLGGISRQAVGRLSTEAMRRLRGKLGERGVSRVSDLLAQSITPKGQNDVEYSKSSTQVTLAPADAKAITDFAKTIPEADLYKGESGTDSFGPKYGREDEPHVTVLYGLTQKDPVPAAKALADAGLSNVTVRLGKLSLFKNEKYDVLKAEIESPDLRRLNKALRDNVPFESDFPDYKPHMTIAYLKPGLGAKYVGQAPFTGRELHFGEVEFRGKDGRIHGLALDTPIGRTLDQLEQVIKAQATDDPLAQLMGLLDSDTIGDLQDRAAAEEPGKRTIGRPDLSLGAEGPAIMGVDEARKASSNIQQPSSSRPQTEAGWLAEAQEMLSRDYEGTARRLAERALQPGGTLDPAETKAAQLIVAQEMSAPLTAESRRRVQALIWAYRQTGTEAARSMRSRVDPFKTPEERNREFLAKVIFTPPAKVRAAMEEADSETKQRLLETDQARIAKIEEELKRMGISFDDILSGETVLRLRGAPIVQNIVGTFADKQQRALKLLQGGERGFAEVAKMVGLGEKEVRAASEEAFAKFIEKHGSKFANGLKAEAFETGTLLAQETGENVQRPTLNVQLSTEALAEARKAWAMAGFVEPAKQGQMKVVRRKAKLFRPPAVPYTGRVPDETPVPFEERTQNQIPFTPEQAFRNVNPPPGGPQEPVTGPTGRVLGQMGLPLYQEMMIRRGADVGNVDDVVKIARVVQAADGNAFDMAYEVWINGILSGPQTHVANVSGNLINAGLDFSLQRGMESLVNLVYQDPGSAQFGEFRYIVKGMAPGWARAMTQAARSWNAEADFFRHDVLNEQVEMFEDFDKGGGARPSIPGKPGRVVRMPGRALMAEDAIFKGLIGQMEVGAQAYRIAKAEGLAGDKLSARINELVATPNSLAWQRAVVKATNLTFQDEIRTKEHGGGFLENAVARLSQARAGSHLLGYFFPFIRTPYNIFKTALRKTPLGTANMAAQFAKAGFYKIRDGKPVFESYSKAEQVKHLAEQIIAWTTFALLWGATTGDEDDDKKPVLLIGSFPRNETKQGERDLNTRAYGGEYQIRFGGRNGTYINYGRYEPVATVLGTVVDAITNLKKLRHGTTKSEALDAMHGYFMAQAESKTFLKAFGDIADLFRGKMSISDFAKKEALNALVPNLIRQPLRNLDEFVRDSKTAAPAYQALPVGAFAQPKIDVYGHPISKGGSMLSRLLFAAGTKPPKLQAADALLLAWNKQHPRETWAPQEANTAGMNATEKRRYLEATGKRALELMPALSKSQIARPLELDVKMIKDAFEQAHRDVKHEMFGGRFSSPSRTGIKPQANVLRGFLANAA